MNGRISSFSGHCARAVGRIVRDAPGFVLVAALCIAGCSSTKISSVWKDPSYQVKPYRIMIIGIARYPANQRTLEDEFAAQINAQGTDCIASYNIIEVEQNSDKEHIAMKMKEQNADTVLITRIESRKSVFTERNLNYKSPPPHFTTWRNYYEYGYNTISSSDNVEETKYALLETNIYNAGDDKLIWSASSETKITGTDQRFIRSYVKAIVKKMVEQGLLVKLN